MKLFIQYVMFTIILALGAQAATQELKVLQPSETPHSANKIDLNENMESVFRKPMDTNSKPIMKNPISINAKPVSEANQMLEENNKPIQKKAMEANSKPSEVNQMLEKNAFEIARQLSQNSKYSYETMMPMYKSVMKGFYSGVKENKPDLSFNIIPRMKHFKSSFKQKMLGNSEK